jgi:hypothetical protein
MNQINLPASLLSPFTIKGGDPDDPDLSLSVDAALTQILDNVVFDLEDLRRRMEYMWRREVGGTTDVRELMPESNAARLLSGINELIEYDDLAVLITAMRIGVAGRRAQS